MLNHPRVYLAAFFIMTPLYSAILSGFWHPRSFVTVVIISFLYGHILAQLMTLWIRRGRR